MTRRRLEHTAPSQEQSHPPSGAASPLPVGLVEASTKLDEGPVRTEVLSWLPVHPPPLKASRPFLLLLSHANSSHELELLSCRVSFLFILFVPIRLGSYLTPCLLLLFFHLDLSSMCLVCK
jgi:hypothetical protein